MEEPAPALAGDSVDGRAARALRPPGQRRRRELLGDVVRSRAATSSPSSWAWRTTTVPRGVEFLGVNETRRHGEGTRVDRGVRRAVPEHRRRAGRLGRRLRVLRAAGHVRDRSPQGTIRWAVYGQTDAAQLAELIDGVLARRPGVIAVSGRAGRSRPARRRRRARRDRRSST